MDAADRREATFVVKADAEIVRIWRDAMKQRPDSMRIRDEYERALARFGEACKRQRRFVDSVTKELCS